MQMKKLLRWIATTALAASMLAGLTSCGGGGVSSDTGLQVGTFNVAPITANLYAGVPFTFVISGGTRPYTVTSNEQTVLPLGGYRVDGNTLTVIPNNPGVVDAGLQEGEVPRRTVNLTVRDAGGNTVIGIYQVLQNFLTGYGIDVRAVNNCDTGGTIVFEACSGFRSRITIRPTTGGVVQRNKTLRFTVLEGQLSFVINEATGALGPEVTATTDELGFASVQFQVPSNARTQFAKVRITEVATGLYRDHGFTINNTAGALNAFPDAIELLGANTTVCGSGVADIIVTGGSPPYTATSTQPSLIAIQPATVTQNGGSFSVTIFAGSLPNCITAQVVVVDSAGRTDTVDITTRPGTTTPITPLTVAPNTICLPDGGAIQVLVSGGNNNKVATVSHPLLIAPVPPFAGAATAVTITATGAAPVGPTGQPASVTFYDGASQAFLSVLRKTTCP